MAIKRRLKSFSGQRLDVTHIRGIESAVTADFDDLVKGLVTGLNNPYVIRGFDVYQAADNDDPANIQLQIADSAILHSTATESGTILAIPATEPNIALNPSNDKVIGSWASNTINYVALDYRRVVDSATVDQVGAWSVSENVEIQKSVPTGLILDYRVIITTSGFGNYLPLYKVYVTQTGSGAQQITYIEMAQPRLFRGGSGGILPDPYHSFPWVTDNLGSRQEGATKQYGAILPTSTYWKTGDYAIHNLKDFIDAVYTRLKEITGSSYWYTDSNLTGSGPNSRNIWWDSLGSVTTSSGSFAFNLKIKTVPNTPSNPSNSIKFSYEDYDTSWPTKLANIYTSANWASTYKDQVEVSDWQAGNESGHGILNHANGSYSLIKGLQGIFTAQDGIMARIKLPIVSLTASGGTATITLAANSLMSGADSIFASDTGYFRGTITGADDAGYNKTDVQITLGSPQTTMTYAVSNSITLPATGNLYLDGVVFIGGMADTISNDPNPAAGPVSWDEDIVIKSVVGIKDLTISKIALAQDSNGTQDPIYGPGTLTLNNDEQVAWIVIDRDLPVGGSGSLYTSVWDGNNQTIQGPSPTYNGYYGALSVRIGDYVKFEGASDLEWRKVTNITVGPTYTILVDDNGNANPFGATYQNYTGKLLVSRGVYGKNMFNAASVADIHITDRYSVPDNANIYWIAYRKDKTINSVQHPTIYLREMELDVGEERQINDNQASNLLIYTGAMSESNNAPDYARSSTDAGFEFEITVSNVGLGNSPEPYTNTIHLDSPVNKGILQGDLFYDPSTNKTYTVAYPLTTKDFVVQEDIGGLGTGSSFKYRRPSANVVDGDNLTVGERKLDRMLQYIVTALSRPTYDESVYVQYVDLTAVAGTINSGDYITWSGSGLAWVLSGTGGETKNPVGGAGQSNRILIHVYNGTLGSGVTITQGATTRVTSSVASDTEIYGAAVGGQVLKLPPNRRAALPNNSQTGPTAGAVYPQAVYKQKSGVGGGELLVISNDTPRECNVDYAETEGGPGNSTATRASIQLIRQQPMYTRIRFRNLATFGTPSLGSASVTLQAAYNGSVAGGGNADIVTQIGKPVIISPVGGGGDTGLKLNGVMEINGAGSGIKPTTDGQPFLGTSTNRFGQVWEQQNNIKTGNNYTGSEWIQKTANITTVGASLNTAFTLALNDLSCYRVTITAVGRRDGTPAAEAAFKMDVVFAREGGGAIIIGAPITSVIGMSTTAYEYVLAAGVSGNNAQINVAGGTGQTVNWALTVDVQAVSTGA
jgi:hypothetical protein